MAMGIGTSDGQYFEDGFDYKADQAQSGFKPGERLYVSPNDIRPVGISPPAAYKAPPPQVGDLLNRERAEDNVINPEGNFPKTEDNYHALTRDENEYTPDSLGDVLDAQRQGVTSQKISSTSSTMPPGGPTEGTGALESNVGTPTPEKLSILNSLRGMGNPSFDEDKKILSGFYDTVKNAFSLPGDVYGGKIDPGSQQGIERSADLAGLMVFGPAPVARKMADGTLGSFAGVGSATADKKALERAVNLHWLGKADRDAIWEDTGWMKSPEGKWKYEIPDSKSKYNTYWRGDADITNKLHGRTAPLTDVLDHPELYKAYPQLKNVQVEYDVNHTSAEWDRPNNKIVLGPDYVNDKGGLLHELQHAIQDIEGFSKGGSPGIPGTTFDINKGTFPLKFEGDTLKLMPEMQNLLRKAMESGLTEEEETRYQYLQKVAGKYLEYRKAGTKNAYENYMRLAGEAEARNVEARQLLNEKTSRSIKPWDTQDRPDSDLIHSDLPPLTTAYGYIDPRTRQTVPKSVSDFRRPANDNVSTPGVSKEGIKRAEESMARWREQQKASAARWETRLSQMKDIGDRIDKMHNGRDISELSQFEQAQSRKWGQQWQDLFDQNMEDH